MWWGYRGALGRERRPSHGLKRGYGGPEDACGVGVEVLTWRFELGWGYFEEVVVVWLGFFCSRVCGK